MLKKSIFICFLIAAAAIFLRLYNVGLWPVFADESIYVRWSQVMRAESTLRFLPLSDGKQPLFMWATIPFFKIISDPLVAARFLSALTGIFTTAGIALLSWLTLKNLRITFWTAAIWATVPYSVFFSRMALVDSMLCMFIVWGLSLSVLSIQKQRLDMAMIAGFFFGFAWLTKSPATIALMLLPSVLIFIPHKNLKTILYSLFYILTPILIAFGMYNILRLGPEFHQIALRNADYVFTLPEILKHPQDPLLPHLKDSVTFYLYLLTPFGVLLSLWGILAGGKSHVWTKLFFGLWFLLPIIALSAVARAFTARYILFTAPFAVILAAHAVEHIGQHTKRHLLSALTGALIIIPSLWIDHLMLTNPANMPMARIERSGYLEEWTAGFGLKEVSARIQTAAEKRPVIVGSEGFFGTPFDGLQMYLNGVPNVRVIGVGVWIDSVHEKLINASVENQIFLVVNSSRFHHEKPEDLGLKLLASYPKAVRPDGTQEYLLFFEYIPK